MVVVLNKIRIDPRCIVTVKKNVKGRERKKVVRSILSLATCTIYGDCQLKHIAYTGNKNDVKFISLIVWMESKKVVKPKSIKLITIVLEVNLKPNPIYKCQISK